MMGPRVPCYCGHGDDEHDTQGIEPAPGIVFYPCVVEGCECDDLDLDQEALGEALLEAGDLIAEELEGP